ncbi:MAG TPA: hypothetical protein VI999_08240 [Thermoplasmata archaeon]|nr:hypothetical protein [Thermoplasmata archaeon]
MALVDPSAIPFQLPGMEYGVWFWILVLLGLFVSFLIGRWMARDARTRDMTPWVWFLVGFLTSLVGLIVYSIVRRSKPVVSFRLADPRKNLYVWLSDLQVRGFHLSRAVVPAIGVLGGVVLFLQVLLRPLDVFAYLFLLLGVAAVALAYFAFHLKAWAWRGIAGTLATGSVVALLALIPFSAIDELRLWVFGTAIAGGAVLSLFKVDFNVGPAYLQYLKERFQPRFQAREVRNPDDLPCPSCGSAELFIAEDGSAFCHACRKGFQQLRA